MALCALGTDLYAGGWFTSAGGNEIANLARWDGNQWWPVGGGVNGPVTALTVIDGELYAGGDFTMAGEIVANRIAKWDGNQWSAFGTGVSDEVFAIAQWGNDLWVGGFFEEAGGQPSAFLGRWGVPVGMEEHPDTGPRILAYPNPFTQSTMISYHLTVNSQVIVKIFDFTGKEVRTLLNEKMAPGEYQVVFDTSGLPAGLYFCRMNAGDAFETIKLLHVIP
jgi:hypothetical protein